MATKDVTDLMVCKAYAEYRAAMETRGTVSFASLESSEFPYEILGRMTGQCEKVCYKAMERADKHGLIDYGVSLRTGWLTAKGEEFLKQHNIAANKG